MTDTSNIPNGIRLSELEEKPVLNDADLIPISSPADDVFVTGKGSISDLRRQLNFENAFYTEAAGIAATVNGQIFHVWTDSSKTYVREFINIDGTPTAVLDSTGAQKTYPSGAAVNELSSLVSADTDTDLQKLYDKDGLLYGIVDQSGYLYLPDMVGLSMQDRFKKSDKQFTDIDTHLSNVDNIITTDAAEDLQQLFDKNGALYGLVDHSGHLYLPDMNGMSFQDRFKTVDKKFIGINDIITTDSSPYINVLNDAQNNALSFMDNGSGDYYLPGMSGLSLQTRFDGINKRLDYLYKSRRIYNAVTDFGVDNTGKTSCSYALQAAENWLYNSGGGVIFYPSGVYRQHIGLIARSNVYHIGAGKKLTRFVPMGDFSSFTRDVTRNVLRNSIFIDIEIDGSEQHADAYDVAMKGLYFQYFADCLFLRLYVHDTGSTGIGTDYPVNCYILDCATENCGRLGVAGVNGGASGIGIGTGAYQDEAIIISRCINRNNKNYGIFFEKQPYQPNGITYDSRNQIVTQSICTGNYRGFGDCGVEGAIITDCQFNENIQHGVVMDPGTLPPSGRNPHPGSKGILANCQINRNGGDGVFYDSTTHWGTGGYVYENLRIEQNGVNGMEFLGGPTDVPDLKVSNCDILDNVGIPMIFNGGTFSNLDIHNIRMLRNAGATGIQLNANISGGSISGSKFRSTNGAAAIAGDGTISNFDIAENQYTDTNSSQIQLTGTLTNVTYGRNPGMGN